MIVLQECEPDEEEQKLSESVCLATLDRSSTIDYERINELKRERRSARERCNETDLAEDVARKEGDELQFLRFRFRFLLFLLVLVLRQRNMVFHYDLPKESSL